MRNPSLPRSIVNNFFQERFLATNPHTEVEKLRELCVSKWSFIRARVAKHPNLELSDLKKLARSPELKIRVAVASHPRADVRILKHLTGDRSILVRRAVALNSQTPQECLEILSRDRNVYVRANVAKNPCTPLEILLLLSQDKDSRIVKNIAFNPAIPQELRSQLQLEIPQREPEHIYLWRRLFSGPYEYNGIPIKELWSQEQYDLAASAITPIPQLLELIKITPNDIYWEAVHNICQQVICNPDISSELLLEILDIRSIDIYAAVASHPHISDAVCNRIVNNEFRDYRLSLLMLQNSNISLDFIEKLLSHRKSEVRQFALKKHQQIFADNDIKNIFLTQYNAATCEQTPLEKLTQLSKHKSVLIREAVAKNPRIIKAYSFCTKIRTCLERLAKDKNQSVRIAVANNINTPIHILEILAKSYQYEPGVHTRYQRHHNRKEHKVFVIAVKKLMQIAPEIASKYLVQYIEPNCHTLDSIPFRLAILQNFPVPIEYLAKKIKTLHLFPWYERYLIVQNPQASTEILQMFLKDVNRVVRAAAKARLTETQ
ncbi:leucine rich repeat variant [Calothrix sp. NIES-4101]|nr:leucine rich repeat variant [Calothrix sp. NIES-4101]